MITLPFNLQDIARLQQHGGDLTRHATDLRARLEEEAEVVAALRAQVGDCVLPSMITTLSDTHPEPDDDLTG